MADLLAVAEHHKIEKRWSLLVHNICADDIGTTLSDNGKQKLQRFTLVIQQALSQQKRHGLRHWIHSIWLALGGPALLLNPSDEENIHTFLNVLNHYDQGGIIKQWNDLEKAVNDLYASPKVIANSETSPGSVKPVQIMTIHKSKGLEFDTVIIPALDKGKRSDDKELIVWLERIGYSPQTHQQQSQLLISPVNATGDEADPIYDFIRQQHAEKEQLESDRVLYVGCTRAIKQLHLLAYSAIDNKKADKQKVAEDEPSTNMASSISGIATLKTPSMHTLLSRLWPSIQLSDSTHLHITHSNKRDVGNDNDMGSDDPTDKNHKRRHPNIILSLAPHWQAPTITANNVLAAYRGNNVLAALETKKSKGQQAENKNAINAQTDLFSAPQKSIAVENEQNIPKRSNDLALGNQVRGNLARENIAKPDALLQREQRYIGTVIHLALQHITETGYQHWDIQRLQQQQKIWQSQLTQQGISPHKIDAALTTVEQAISQTLNDKTGQWLLDNSHSESATEQELWNAKGQHIIDRTFIVTASDKTNIEKTNGDKNQKTRWIIDYKSSQPNEGETLEAFTKKQTDEYQPQLQRYKKLFNNENTHICAGLYFVLSGIWIEV
jgi:ATP-dependent exoDNAse (exonuclease V) beta subunit